MRCIHCGKRSFQSSTERQVVTISGRTFRGTVPSQVCENCSQALIKGRDLEAWDRAVVRELASHGPATGEALSYMRRTIGLKANELAALLEVTPTTVSRWENSKKPIDRATWLAVGDLATNREGTVARLEALSRKQRHTIKLNVA